MRRLCSVALALALLVWELGVGFQAVFAPHVSRFYADYYIHHRRACWLPEAQVPGVAASLRVADLEISHLTPDQRCYLLMSGWTHEEAWGVWSSKPEARLDVPVVPGAKVLVLRLEAVGPAQVVDVLAGKQALQRLVLGPSERDVAIPVVGTGDLVVTLRPEGFFTKHGFGLLGVLWQ